MGDRPGGALPESERASLVLDAALFEALWRGDAARAHCWLESVPSAKAIAPCEWWLVHAAIARAEGDLQRSSYARARARAAYRESLVPGSALMYAAALERLADERPGT